MDIKHLTKSELISLIGGQLAGLLQGFHEGAQNDQVDFDGILRAVRRIDTLIEESLNHEVVQ